MGACVCVRVRACACVRVRMRMPVCAFDCVFILPTCVCVYAHECVLRECVGCSPTENLRRMSDDINDGRRCECVLTGPVMYKISAMRALGICVWPQRIIAT